MKTTFLDRYEKFNVSKLTKITFVIPAIVVIIALAVVIGVGATTGSYTNGVNIGIDFEGGTVLTVDLNDAMLGDMSVDEHLEYVRDVIQDVEDANGSHVVVSYTQVLSGNGNTSLSFRYKNVSSSDAEINELNEAIIAAVDAAYPERPNEEENFITYESIGATAARDLLSNAGIALAVSTVLILIYIIIRFTPMAAFAAVLALVHDVIVMFALTVICRVQINSSYVAAMITIIAYSINNTIIIFDRCREYLKPMNGMRNIDYNAVGDLSVRENMRRSVFTTATTMITVVLLAIIGSAMGSASLNEFCVPIILGLLAGLYSSVFLATPMWAAFSESWDKQKAKRQTAVSYAGALSRNAESDDEEILFPETAARESDDDAPAPAKPANKGSKPGGGKPIYKYSKKNTKFKKKK